MDNMMKSSLSVASSPYLAKPLRSIAQAKAEQDEKRRLEAIKNQKLQSKISDAARKKEH
ncbi:hypothetical protein [Kiloniella litopenaei]|uniref:hypothetical protein n=1 Tax=Kiloniella litopenaei TaxID=1549748 RepID=UPI0012FF092D|nr:hypothetical protein [Kiloniella litopenaei]